MCSCAAGERPLVSDWDRGAAEAVGVNPEHGWYSAVCSASETKPGRWDMSQIKRNNRRKMAPVCIVCWCRGDRFQFPNHSRTSAFILSPAQWVVRRLVIYIAKKNKQMHSHFVHTCEVSNYTERISAVSQSNIFASFLMSTCRHCCCHFFECKLPAFRLGGAQFSSDCHLERQDGTYFLELRFSHSEFAAIYFRVWQRGLFFFLLGANMFAASASWTQDHVMHWNFMSAGSLGLNNQGILTPKLACAQGCRMFSSD